MKHFILPTAVIAVISVLVTPRASFGLCLGRMGCTGGTLVAQGANCATSSRICYGTQAVISCATCSSGTLTEATVSVDACDDAVTYNTCVSSGSGGSTTACTAAACSSEIDIDYTGQHCATYASATCMGDTAIKSCASCLSGYETSTSSITVSGCSNTLSFTTCVSTCDGTCDNCTSTDWMLVFTASGYQSRTTAVCNSSTCTCAKTTQYRCTGGYYGSSPSCGLRSCSGCTACPDSGTSLAGVNSAITGCYITGGSDATGTYIFDRGQDILVDNDKCYYSE